MPAQHKIKESSILYVEDDEVTRKQIAQFLKPQCKTLYTALNGQEAFELYEKFSPDIVITDIEMPKLNGLELAKKIRACSLTTQIIIITAYKTPKYLFDAVNLQLVQYLLKPINLDGITRVLDFASNFLKGIDLETKKHFSKNMHYDTYTKELINNRSIINLSKYERALVELLLRKHPAPASYEFIDEHIYDYRGSKNAIKLLVSSLREKVGGASIVNTPGFGYKIKLVSLD